MTTLQMRDAAMAPLASAQVAETVGTKPSTPPLRSVAALYDGSPAARAALAPARALAARLDADLVVIRVGTPEDSAAGLLASSRSAATLEEAVSAAQAQGLRARGLEVAVPGGCAAAGALFEEMREHGAGLLVLATPTAPTAPTAPAAYRSADSSSCASPGGLVEAVMAQSRLPLLLVPPYYGSRTGDGAMQWLGWDGAALAGGRAGHPSVPLRLLVALDGSPVAERALPLAAGLAQWVGAHLSLIRVVPANSTLYCPGNGPRGAIENGLDYLQRVAMRLQGDGVRPDAIRIAVRVGDAAETLLSQAGREHTTILMLAAPASRGVSPGMGSSVTAHLLRRAPLPVLVVPDATDVGGQTQPVTG